MREDSRCVCVPTRGIERHDGISKGSIAVLITYVVWGLFHLYWHLMRHVDALEILADRMVWQYGGSYDGFASVLFPWGPMHVIGFLQYVSRTPHAY